MDMIVTIRCWSNETALWNVQCCGKVDAVLDETVWSYKTKLEVSSFDTTNLVRVQTQVCRQYRSKETFINRQSLTAMTDRCGTVFANSRACTGHDFFRTKTEGCKQVSFRCQTWFGPNFSLELTRLRGHVAASAPSAVVQTTPVRSHRPGKILTNNGH